MNDSKKDRKRRRRESAQNEDSETRKKRNRHYKNLRKLQKKRRKERKKAAVAGNEGRQEQKPQNASKQNSAEGQDARKRDFSRGKRLVSAALNRNVEESRTNKRLKPTTQTAGVAQNIAQSSSSTLKEISSSNLRRVMGSKPIGSGTFGTCFLAKYRDIEVVIKEYKDAASSTTDRGFERRRKEATYEARVIQQLGDHPGIPLLLGVVLQQQPVSIVLKFHGSGDNSLTLIKAAKEKNIAKKDWQKIFCEVADALKHIHQCGYIHNDLKSNNVVLETSESILRPRPVIIDFGKSVLAVKAKKPNAKPVCMRGNYKNSYIAPELINGTCKPSVKTDIYAFCFMIKSVYRLLKFNFPPIVGDTLIQHPQSRPSIEKLKECLTE